MDLQLEGKSAIVTGGSRGIGKAIARSLISEGVNVVISARNRVELDATAEELRIGAGCRVIPIPVDTGYDESVKSMVDHSFSELGRIDILVNCAARPLGQGIVPGLSDITNEDFWQDMNVKVMGYLRCSREVASYMKNQGWGRIINISGLASRQTGSTIGSMRNVAVTAMTKNLADELGPDGINVTVVHPGPTRTERTPTMIADAAKTQGVSIREAENQMTELNSVRRIIDAEDVAYVVTFLASPKSLAINGDSIAAGGGLGKAIYY